MKILNRFTGAQLFEFDSIDQRKVVLEAIKSGADLRDANLRGADLRGADLSRADLRDANLRDANLRGADLSDADLSDANLRGADLRGADLRDANLRGADLRGADLKGADLKGADLSNANLSRADLSRADLCDANLSRADLRDANLKGADLSNANLKGADLSNANLSRADLKKLVTDRNTLPDGDLIGWKKLEGGVICKLRIPSDAKRVGGLTNRKYRAEYAIVIEGEGFSRHDSGFCYSPGSTVRPDRFDPNPLIVCSSGIHFFITKEEAEAY